VFSTLREQPSAPDDGAGGRALLRYFREDPNFARFVVARGFLTATALSPPYLVLLTGDTGGALGELGALVIASAAAAFVSSWAWGRFADRSSRTVLVAAGVIGAGAMGLAVAVAAAEIAPGYGLAGALFVLMIAHHGVRNGRSTYLVDIAPEDARAGYAAASNTAIGGLLLVSGLFGGALSFLGPSAALIGFAAMAVIGAGVALGLREAE
jgi:MFS family permease